MFSFDTRLQVGAMPTFEPHQLILIKGRQNSRGYFCTKAARQFKDE